MTCTLTGSGLWEIVRSITRMSGTLGGGTEINPITPEHKSSCVLFSSRVFGLMISAITQTRLPATTTQTYLVSNITHFFCFGLLFTKIKFKKSIPINADSYYYTSIQ